VGNEKYFNGDEDFLFCRCWCCHQQVYAMQYGLGVHEKIRVKRLLVTTPTTAERYV